MLSFIIGVVLRLANLLFAFFPFLGDITTGFGEALVTIFTTAAGWDWLLPIHESLQLVERTLQVEFGIILIWFGKWIVEMIRGK